MNSLLREVPAKRLARYVAIIAVPYLMTTVAAHWFQVGLNTTSSIEGSLFLIKKYERPGKGDLVAFVPPANRFYHHRWFVKNLVGVPGDVVTADGYDVYIDGKFVATAKPTSRNGLSMMPPPTGAIPPKHFFAGSEHPDGFDSRYGEIGFVHVDRIIGRAYRVF